MGNRKRGSLVLGQSRGQLFSRWKTYAVYLSPVLVLGLIVVPRLIANDVSVGVTDEVGSFRYLLTELEVLPHYIGLVLFPRNLCFDYQWPIAEQLTDVILVRLLTPALFAATMFGVTRKLPLASCGIWFFIILAPTSSILPINDAAVEHRMYLPAVSVIVLTFVATKRLLQRLEVPSAVANVIFACVVCALFLRTFVRTQDYHSGEDLWQSVVECSPDNDQAYAYVMYFQNREEKYAAVLQTALAFHEQTGSVTSQRVADEIGPTFCDRSVVEAAIRRIPGDDSARISRLEFEQILGISCEEVGRWDLAVTHHKAVVDLQPESVNSRATLAFALSRIQQFAAAEEQLRAAVRLQPNNAELRYNLGAMCAAQGALERASEHFEAALEIDPQFQAAITGLARLRAEEGL